MGSHVEEVEAVDSAVHTTQPLDDVVDNISKNAGRVEAVSNSFDHAVSRAMHLPGGAPKVVEERINMTGMDIGEVAAQKSSVVSDVSRDNTADMEKPIDDELDPIAARFRSLYSEMTNWQVAWSIAQRTQQDVNQLLKGN